jgi:hypothetical protein
VVAESGGVHCGPGGQIGQLPYAAAKGGGEHDPGCRLVQSCVRPDEQASRRRLRDGEFRLGAEMLGAFGRVSLCAKVNGAGVKRYIRESVNG